MGDGAAPKAPDMTPHSPLQPASPRLLTSMLDHLVVPGLARFTRFGYRCQGLDQAPVRESLAGRTVVLTGATAGLGRAAARQLAALGARLVLVGRDPARLAAVGDEIAREVGDAEVSLETADLSLSGDTMALAHRLLARETPVHVLVNNAAVLEPQRRTTREGLEVSLATNLLSPYPLTTALLPRPRASAPSRIVNVVSGGMYLAGLGPEVFEPSDAWDGAKAYARQKRALMVLTEHWARALAADGIAVNAMHPGWAETPGVARSLPLFLRLTRPVLRTPEEGADTIVWLAASQAAGARTGGLWLDREAHPAAVFPGTSGTPAERAWLLDQLARLAASVAPPASPEGERRRRPIRRATRN